MNAEDKRREIIAHMLKGSGDSLKRAAPSYPDSKAFQDKQKRSHNVPEPIAIIGLSGYLPQCMSVKEFWRALDEDKILIEKIPEGRIDWRINNEGQSKWAGLIPNVRDFDPRFFGILPSEASTMDPRKRMLMMAAYHAIEDAGYAPKSLGKSDVGVFVAIEEDEYRQYLSELNIDLKSGDGNSSSLIANQLSYFFDFHGPSEIINTMCSGAAIAIHRAVQTLRSGEISCALVGGANILLHEDPFIYLSRSGQMSPTNTVNSFGHDAHGFLRADGLGVIVLKPLSKAEADNDAIYAVIKNTAVNFNGRGGMSMAAPNISSHTEVIQSCYEEVNVDPSHVGYIEAQGMGNPVADIVEWEACNRALKAVARNKNVNLRDGACRISTLKPMTGHMHSASALGALFKIIRSFKTNKIHKILGLTEANPDLNMDNQPCRLAAETENWPEEKFLRLAGLHSYGSGGNNAHILVEEYKTPVVKQESVNLSEGVVVPFSAETEKQCKMLVRAMLMNVEEHPEYDILSIAHTLQAGRDQMKYRIAFVARSRDEFIGQVKEYLGKDESHEGLYHSAKNISLSSSDSHLAAAWVKGEDVRWAGTNFKNARRLHLAVYPFNCQEYWVERQAAILDAKTQVKISAPLTKITKSCLTCGGCNGENKLCANKTKISIKNGVSERAEQIVRETLSFFLRISPGDIDIDREFSAMGFDSLLVVNLVHRLKEQYQLDVEPAIFFEHTTPRQLISFLTGTLGDKIIFSTDNSADAVKERENADENEELFRTQRFSTDDAETDKDPVAIIGLAGSFPGSPDLESFWKNIAEGKDCIEVVPADRWSVDEHFHPDKTSAAKTGKSYGKWGGFIHDAYFFDPLFFNISPSEAELMNPKERMFLQCSWHVMEDAGYTPQSLSEETVGVFVGVTRSGLDPYKVSMFPVANRVSYTFNFKGPSMPIDTACSSSLVALHEACQHIQTGECTVAIAGGVHVFLDPSHFAALSALQMLSPDGVTRSFGDQANGMVPGEGVGAVMLKRLSSAVADGDRIYGVIRGSSINHGGKANGFTVPNPKAHAALIQNTLRKAHIQPGDISYVEAHGTGTSLGDPIEIRGLSEAFKKIDPNAQYCPIGSVKSNIGHLEAAAGISGVMKVLLQMKHRKLAPSLHSNKPNDQIDFSKTPFYIQHELIDWLPVGKNGREIPRIACASSFGAGGANAHIIIQEYNDAVEETEKIIHDGEMPVMILLSAKSELQLKEQITRLLSFVKDSSQTKNPNALLSSIAYTLQVGREAMEERLGFTASSLPELENKLITALGGHSLNSKNICRGNIKRQQDTLDIFSNDPEMEHVIDSWYTQRNYDRLANLWIKGFSLNWKKLYERSPAKIGLPLYPFLKEHFPSPGVKIKDRHPDLTGAAVEHPLVHQNTSTFSRQKFISVFNGDEFFLRDHIVNERRTLPGVAYLEMVYAAMKLAGNDGDFDDESSAVQLKNIAWIRPVTIQDQPVRLVISLVPDGDDCVSFEICGENAGETAPVVHSQGSVQFVRKSATPMVSIDVMKTACISEISAGDCYSAFDKLGITYGPAHRGMKDLWVGEQQALARVQIPDEIIGTSKEFFLHPSLLDAAFQAIMGSLVLGQSHDKSGQPSLAVPFALEELTVFEKCSTGMWAVIRQRKSREKDTDLNDVGNLSFDIDLCDDNGMICVQMKGFTSRVIRKDLQETSSVLYLLPTWREMTDPVSSHDEQNSEHIILYPDGFIDSPQVKDMNFVPIAVSNDQQVIVDYVLLVFNEVQKILSAKKKNDVMLQVIVDRDSERLAVVDSLLRSAHLENPKFFGQVIIMEKGLPLSRIIDMLKENRLQPEAQRIKYEEKKRFVLQLSRHTPEQVLVEKPWRDRGIYLITGGLGGLGAIFTREIASQTKGAVVVLTGRSELTEQKKCEIENLQSSGARVEYWPCDIANREDVEALIERTLRDHSRIDGIIHCAGLLRDNFILKKTNLEIREVLAPKILGLQNLDEATKNIPLNFFVMFSSVAGVMGNSGQSDYAVANAFMDDYAHYRNALTAKKERSGVAVSINWPLWKEGGMGVDEQLKEIMRNSIGMHPMETTNGISAFYEILASGHEQMMLVEGYMPLLTKIFLPDFLNKTREPVIKRNRIPEEQATAGIDAAAKERAIVYFKKLLSGVIKLSPDRIDAERAMDEYGIDSIMVMQLTAELEKVFGSLPKTLFFEYRNLVEIAEYFFTSHAEKMAGLLNINGNNEREKTVSRHDAKQQVVHAMAKPKLNSDRKHRLAVTSPAMQEVKNGKESLNIAVIGVAGRYPKARNLNEFWDNLCEGKNCVTEIPQGRWDHSLYFDPDKTKDGKTNTKWGGFIDGVDEFDALFFNISPVEAEITDPQERLFLQCAFETLEDAGYTRQQLAKDGVHGKVGVFAGVMWTEYQLYGAQSTLLGKPQVLSSGAASIANRVSYFCNFNGPSLGVDTMCSSSLTAVHLACQSIARGECELALAGGVNVSIHPNKYLVLGHGKLASSKGLCESFGGGGDGYVASEGVGTILLKPLEKAIKDGDNIYGVIQGTAINHGGKVNGYSVPNPKAQSNAIYQAINQSGFDPRSITYVEAHGTGTALGDPIEIAGLTSGFKTDEKQFCSIGSVKSNIGHAESAAGIAGITKVLLQMKHRKLVPSLHSSTLNPNIDFLNSPFFVQQQLGEWTRPTLNENGTAQAFPLRAGISSFGAGGSNAHVLIEEYSEQESYVQDQAEKNEVMGPVLIVLSAKNEDGLKALAVQLTKAIQNKLYAEKDLTNIAYTLQNGREAMEERIAIEVGSLRELEEKLSRFVCGETEIENLYIGKAKNGKDILNFFTSDEDMEATIESWFRKRKYAKLLTLWVNGFDVAWEKLYDFSQTVRRISLPTYPFARNRYWPDFATMEVSSGITGRSSGFLHPLVHQNTSTFSEQKFTSSFTGEEFFLKHHVIKGKKLLPGVAYLEMINEAVLRACGRNGIVKIENMIWARPFVVGDMAEELTITLTPLKQGEIDFEIIGTVANEGEVKYGKGVAKLIATPDEPLTLDIDFLKRTSNKRVVTDGECYDLFSTMGMEYGRSQRAIENIYVGEQQLLAKLRLPESIVNTLDQYYLHPSLADASLQALIGFLFEYPDKQAAVPFAVESVEIFARCTPHMWAYARYSDDKNSMKKNGDISQLSFDIVIADETGKICARFHRVTSRIIREVNEVSNILAIEPSWIKNELASVGNAIAAQQHIIIVAANEIADTIRVKLPTAQVKLVDFQESTIDGFSTYAQEVFQIVKDLLEGKPKNRILVQILVPFTEENQVLASTAGLLKTAQLENPLFTGQVIFFEQGDNTASLVTKLKENEDSAAGEIIRYRYGTREIFSLREHSLSGNKISHIWKNGGVYLITGGNGGLGLIFAKEIARQTDHATVVLVGRSPLDEKLQSKLDEIRSIGVTIEYRTADITDATSVHELIQFIVHTYGNLHGIVHGAGVLHDGFIIKKGKEEFERVLAPKIAGATNLDAATEKIQLDLFILCSSTAGVTGNAGQADYAMANAYLDWFARYRNARTRLRNGKTISVNWPLWKEGGMQIGEEKEQSLARNFGMAPLETNLAFDTLYNALSDGLEQLVLFQGDIGKLKNTFLRSFSPKNIESAGSDELRENHNLNVQSQRHSHSGIRDLIIDVLSGTLKLPANQIKLDKRMEEYGVDSVMIMRMTNELEKTFGSLPKTLFFEYETIEELAGYFEEVFPEKIKVLAAGEDNRKVEKQNLDVKEQSIDIPKNRFEKLDGNDVHNPDKALEIAIVGLSGSYPQARNIKEFTEILKKGKNCITEIPSDRWDHNKYFDPQKNTAGKTYAKWGGFLKGVDEFDPIFFGITPKEAAIMDPQERLFLQCVYETLEDAGYTKNTLTNKAAGGPGNVGVYVGVMNEEYQLFGPQETALGRPLVLSGNSAAIANRISYFFNFNGPSITLNTMCSSSLTTVHLACQGLMLGECDVAIAGGVNVTVHPNKYLALSYGNFLSSKGLCETFGVGGDGYVPGEGVGSILLKPLAKAIADNDHIYGVIKGTAINHGGKANGYTVPNPKAQTTVVEKAFKVAGFAPETVSYLEAHGTGTALGDPIEVVALNKAFGTDKKHFCAIGSVKTNIGHCESAAGIAGITKVLLQLKHRQLFPSLHAESINPNIEFENSPFVVQQKLQEWKRPIIKSGGKEVEVPRRAGVSSFGAGGANAHILIEEFVPPQNYFLTARDTRIDNKPLLIILSAQSETQLKQYAENLVGWIRELEEHSYSILADVAYTLQTGRESMDVRLALEASTFQHLEAKLTQFIKGEKNIAGFCTGTVSDENDSLQNSEADSNTPDTLNGFFKNGDYLRVMDLWIKGIVVEWDRFYQSDAIPVTNPPRRISLPTYPFVRRHCWFDLPPAKLKDADVVSTGAKSNNEPFSEAVLLKKNWRLSSRNFPKAFNKGAGILYSSETKDIATELGKRINGSVLYNVEKEFSDWTQQSQWNKLDAFVDLTGCGDLEGQSLDWIKDIQSLIEKRKRQQTQLLCVTRGLALFENEQVNLTGALRAGLYRMLGSEYTHVFSRQMDVDPISQADEIAQQIADELSIVDGETEAVYRNGKRYVPQLKEISIETPKSEHFYFSENEVLWITGGTRGLGYLCATHFIKKYGVKKLILSGREALPDRSQWDELGKGDSETAKKIKNVMALEAMGVMVKVLALPLHNKEAVLSSLQTIKAAWGNIHGLIHCAGMVDGNDPAFIKKSIDDIAATMSPKVQGLNVLYDSLRSEPLKCFILFSSVSAVIPSLAAGQAAYAMSNAYMDSFAESKCKDIAVVSIQWPSWKETGMGEIKTRAYRQTGLSSLTNIEGLNLLDRVIAHPEIGPVVLPAYIQRTLWRPEKLLQLAPVFKPQDIDEGDIKKSNVPDFEGLTIKVKEWATNLFAKELNFDPIELKPEKHFHDYGVDSILIMQLLQRVKKILAKELDPSILFEYSTIKSFSEWLVQNYPVEMSGLFTAERDQKIKLPIDNDGGHQTSVSDNSLKFSESSLPQINSADIAVVGMTCRFPGAENLEAYWTLLTEGMSGIAVVPNDRWNNDGRYFAGMIKDPYSFDSKFFSLHHEDAQAMDPQAWLVLEESLKLFYHAGYTSNEVRGKSIGVYLGARSRHSPQSDQLARMRNPIIAVGQNYLSANVSQFFDLRGPSMTVDTACSSALVGMNMAMQALQQGEIECAVVGGVSLLNSDETHRLFEQRGILNEGKDFHLFDGRAKGIVLGEGIGMVLLKTVDRALADGDTIYTTIKSVSINNDGKTAGPATPNLEALKEVMKNALAKAGKKPAEIGYLEVNGSGSEITDLIELKAIDAVYRSSDKNPYLIGSVKPNIGHPLCAEGIASFVKVSLMLYHRQFVPFLSGQQPMKYFDIASSAFRFSRTSDKWTDEHPVAAINCFADGGTNAHVILEACNIVGEDKHNIRKPLTPPTLNRRSLQSKPNESKLSEIALSGERFENDPVFEQEVFETVWETFN